MLESFRFGLVYRWWPLPYIESIDGMEGMEATPLRLRIAGSFSGSWFFSYAKLK